MWVIKTQSLEPEDISPPPDEDCRRAEGGTNFYKAVLYMFLFSVLRVRVGHLILLRIQIQKQYAIVGMEMDFSNMNCLTLILAKWKIIIDEQGKWRPKYQVSSENCYYVGADFSLHLVHQGKRKKRNRKCRRKKDEHGNEPKNRGIMFTSCQEEQKKKVVVERIKNNVIGDKIDPKAVLNLDPGLGVLDAFFASLSMILVSEIGDETFIIAALMAMHHPKSIVLSGALSALFVMTILSTGLGRIVPNLISRKHTNSVATGISLCLLWAVFALYCLEIRFKSISKKGDGASRREIRVWTSQNSCTQKLESGQGKTLYKFDPIFCKSTKVHFVSLTGQKIVYVMDVNKLGNVVTRIFENARIFYYLLRRQQGKNHWGSYSIGMV
ncbi:hypothetical protein Lser_V15G24630 [Lactuca serriola]